jgi:myo-inositol-1(or 4)-monophosphatase
MTAQCAGLRRPGAASLDLAYVAAGRYDGFLRAA